MLAERCHIIYTRIPHGVRVCVYKVREGKGFFLPIRYTTTSTTLTVRLSKRVPVQLLARQYIYILYYIALTHTHPQYYSSYSVYTHINTQHNTYPVGIRHARVGSVVRSLEIFLHCHRIILIIINNDGLCVCAIVCRMPVYVIYKTENIYSYCDKNLEISASCSCVAPCTKEKTISNKSNLNYEKHLNPRPITNVLKMSLLVRHCHAWGCSGRGVGVQPPPPPRYTTNI